MPIGTVVNFRYGLRKPSPTALCVAAATPIALYTMPLGRTFVIRKVNVWNGQGAPVEVQIGSGLGGLFGQLLPSLYAINGMDNEWTEDQLPNTEFVAAATVQASAAGAAPANVRVTLEVEEYQGPIA